MYRLNATHDEAGESVPIGFYLNLAEAAKVVEYLGDHELWPSGFDAVATGMDGACKDDVFLLDHNGLWHNETQQAQREQAAAHAERNNV